MLSNHSKVYLDLFLIDELSIDLQNKNLKVK